MGKKIQTEISAKKIITALFTTTSVCLCAHESSLEKLLVFYLPDFHAMVEYSYYFATSDDNLPALK